MCRARLWFVWDKTEIPFQYASDASTITHGKSFSVFQVESHFLFHLGLAANCQSRLSSYYVESLDSRERILPSLHQQQ